MTTATDLAAENAALGAQRLATALRHGRASAGQLRKAADLANGLRALAFSRRNRNLNAGSYEYEAR